MKLPIGFRLFFFILIFLFCKIDYSFGQSNKSYRITRVEKSPKIDGNLNDSCWFNIPEITDFLQYEPNFNTQPTQKSSISIIYNNEAIFVKAKLEDAAPDSILKQLGLRDEELNADYFFIQFDTYNKQSDAYSFIVSASGVQSENRELDESYDAVWESAVTINEEGWNVEIKIPYSAIRFPNINDQTWGMQIMRSIRRNRELDMWSLQVKGAENAQAYWGSLEGIKNMISPLRLSFTPYLSGNITHFPLHNENISNLSKSLSGGLDLKYGLNEAFTLDMTMLPDFSQVQSDNIIKNLTAFETVYDEQRPFFQEAVDLFKKCDLFYTRRIGRTPLKYYEVENSLDSTEVLNTNPSQAQLLNATKISGRNKKGLALGIFNAITGNTYSEINNANGKTRKYLTDPATNYNIFVLDKIFKNNTNLYLINTNVIRSSFYNDANVLGSGFSLLNKKSVFKISGNAAISNKFFDNDSIQSYYNEHLGLKSNLNIAKIKGNFLFLFSNTLFNKNFDANDLGVTQKNNLISNGIKLNYNIYNPFWVMREFYNNISLNRTGNFETGNINDLSINYGNWGTLKNYLSIWSSFYIGLTEGYDYYEPRIQGKYYINPQTYYINFGFSSDYRKVFALDGSINKGSGLKNNFNDISLSLKPIIRFSDKLKTIFVTEFSKQSNEKGFVTILNQNEVIFGNRAVNNITNTLSANYIFKNDLSLSINLRHYWASGVYNEYYLLKSDGYLSKPILYQYNPNFNFNSLNLDLVFNWKFAPGSFLSIVWKNTILNESDLVNMNYYKNIEQTINHDQLNIFSLKVLYYLDYLTIKNKLFNK